MAYLGNKPVNNFVSFAKQDITGNGGTSYTLDYPVTGQNDIELFINNVRQEPTEAYSCSGTTLTLTEAVQSTDDIYVIFRGRAIQTATHPSDLAISASGGTFSGNVGIGTSSPAYTIDAASSGNTQIHLKASGQADGLEIGQLSADGGSAIIATNNNYLKFGTNNTERMRITSGGNVGIGTSSPSQKLEVSGGSGDVNAVVSTAGASNQAGLTLSNGTRSFRIISDGSGNALKIYDDTAGAERMRLTADGKLGIGTSSPLAALHVKTSTTDYTGDVVISGTRPYLVFDDVTSGQNGFSIGVDGGVVTFGQGDFSTNSNVYGTERMRLDQSGNLLVGKSAYNNNDNGVAITPSGTSWFTATNDYPLGVNRKSSDGTLITFTKNGTTVGRIGITAGDNMYFQGSSGHVGFESTGAGLVPWEGGSSRDNVYDLGTSAARWDDVYATNGTIQTSDQNEKQNIETLTDAEITAAKAISKLFKTFKWKDRVATEGDAARTHTGVIAQEVEAAMSDAGLDAGDYAFFISTTWWETSTEVAAVEADEENGIEAQDAYTSIETYNTQEEAPEGAVERNRKGIRYPELLSFIGAATEQRLTSIEARLDALEGE